MEENVSIEWNMEWKIFGMEWKKNGSMEYGKIILHAIPYHALGGVLEEVIGLEDTFWSPWPCPRGLKFLKIGLSSARGQHYFLNC